VIAPPHLQAKRHRREIARVTQWADFMRERPAVRKLIEMNLVVYQTAAGIIERSQKVAAATA
jgi:hypothetical protein